MNESLTRRDLRLLIAEDEPIFSGYLEDVLNGLFAHIEVLPSLNAVEQRLGSGDIDAILLDLTLNDAAGLAPIHAIRKTHPYLPIIVMTAGDIAAHKALAAGACDFLHKNDILPGPGRDPAQLIFDTVAASVAYRATMRVVHQAGVRAAVEAQARVQEEIRARMVQNGEREVTR